jgi:hypothetical protein
MPMSGATSFTVDSFLTSPDATGATAYIQMRGVCSDIGLKFRIITIAIAAGGTSSMPTDARRTSLSIQIPRADFDNLLGCLQQLPVVVTIAYDLVSSMIAVTSVTYTSLMAGFQLLDQISNNTQQIPQIAKAQQQLSSQLSHVENLVKALDPKHPR